MRNQKRKEPKMVEDFDSEEDEEISEDGAFNSEDERKYGSFFAKGQGGSSDEGSSEDDSEEDSNSEDEEGIASDDEDQEGDGGQYMLDLLSKLDSSTSNNATEASVSAKLAANVKESEFESSVVSGTQLTLDALMEGLEDTKGYGVMQKTMKLVAQGKATSAPVSSKITDRAERKVHYQHQSKEIALWLDAVKQNREAESLDFRPKERLELTRDELVDKFVPTTEFEKELSAALEKAGQQDEQAILEKEKALLEKEDDLGSNKLPMEEYKKRRGELAKIRALMFYHEQKRHHINKIKSKKYRRIRKKQRARQKEAEMTAHLEEDPDLAKELAEKEEMERMKERMTLAHKNTSKWAKRVLKRGKNVDTDTRRALSAQLQRGEDLRRKMNSVRGAYADDEDDDDEEEDLAESARHVLAQTEIDSNDAHAKTGLFKLSFMQRGIERQRVKAKEEALQLLRELEANRQDDDDFSTTSDNPSDADHKPKKKTKVASKAEMKEVLHEGKMVASTLEFGSSNSVSVNRGIEIDLSTAFNHKVTNEGTNEALNVAGSSSHTESLQIADHDVASAARQEAGKAPTDARKRSKITTPNHKATSQANNVNNDERNPWLDAVRCSNKSKTSSKTSREKNVAFVDIGGAASLMRPEETKPEPEPEILTSTREETEDHGENSVKISSMTQEQLVRKAFASSAEADVEKEFEQEKKEMTERDDPTRRKVEKTKAVAGWGDWAGKGAPPPRPRKKLPKRLKAPEKKTPKRKRQDEKKPHVIINEKRLKRTANNYQIAHIPYPYSTREEYERAMTGGVGPEWNVTSSVKSMTRPEIYTRAGKVIQPLSKRVKQKRAPAKF